MPTLTDTAPPHTADVPFAFGQNWARFLARLDAERILAAEDSLKRLLHRDNLAGVRFLDAGSGSGLFSLAAYRLGGDVTSFDVDTDSVACTSELKRRFGDDADRWRVLDGSLLDRDFLASLGEFDVVYCWGVAHHTGDMWRAVDGLLPQVKPGGVVVLAIYNDQAYISRAWRAVKRGYQRMPAAVRPVYVAAIGAALFAKRLVATIVAGLLRAITLRNPLVPFLNWARESQARGMHVWHDLIDWVGGWPFEVARPEDVFRHLRDRGFMLQELTTTLGHGCNEFVARREEKTSPLA